VFFDEEGTFKACDRFFLMTGFHTPIIGKGLIIGANRRGDTIDAETPIDTIKRNTRFLVRSPLLGMIIPTTEPWTPEPDTSDIPEVGADWFKKARVVKPE
jgi:hypothetical protein